MDLPNRSTQAASRFVKTGANDPAAINALVREKAQQDIRNLLIAGLGVGAAGRGLMGLYNMTRRSLRPAPAAPSPGMLTVRIPTRPEEEEEEKKLAHDGFATDPPTSSDTEARPYAIGPPWLANIPISDEEEVDSHLNGTKMAVDKPGIFSPESAETRKGIWWYPVGSVLGAGAGLYGGWKLVDSVLDYRRRKQQEAEMEKAREQFRSALRPTKQASELGRQLDDLYDALQEKQAGFGEFARQGAGAYGVYAGLSALLSGMWMYDRARKRQRRALLEAAKAKRLRQRFQQRPPQIMAIPAEEEEEDNLPKLPAAAVSA